MVKRTRQSGTAVIAAAVLSWASGPAAAQLPGGLPGGAPSLPSPSLPSTRLPTDRLPTGRLDSPLDAAGEFSPRELLRARDVRLATLVRENRDLLEADPAGWPVIRAEILATAMGSHALERAQSAGFRVLREERLDELDLQVVVLAPPPNMPVRRAVERLRRLDPAGTYEYNHVYGAAGAATKTPVAAAAGASAASGGVRMGLIDGGVDTSHPALRGARIEQRSFGGGGSPSAHGTAVASLLVGHAGRFRGAAPGGGLLVADVYGPRGVGGSAASVAQALAWMTRSGVGVINISLVGPRNAVLEAAIAAMVRRGHLIVAAVGNDGPAAAPLHPAALPGVIGVSAVNGRGRVLPEAGRGPHVDFSAPGADMAAAGSGSGFVEVRGTSFAAPVVAGLLARRLSSADPGAAARAVQALAGEADDAGARGADPVYGRGVVGAALRADPTAVKARGRLTR